MKFCGLLPCQWISSGSSGDPSRVGPVLIRLQMAITATKVRRNETRPHYLNVNSGSRPGLSGARFENGIVGQFVTLGSQNMLLLSRLSIGLTLVAALNAQAQQGAIGDVAASPAVALQQAVKACESHVRAGIPLSSGSLSGAQAGAEQDGYILVSGQVLWRTVDRQRAPFACVIERAGNRVATSVIPEFPQATPSSTAVTPALIAACKESITFQVRQAHGVPAVFDGDPKEGRDAQGRKLQGSGKLGSAARSVARASSSAGKFTYLCRFDLQNGTITRSNFQLDP